MAVLETVSAILTMSSLIATIYFKRHAFKRYVKRQYHVLKTKYRQYRDRRATNATSVRYMPVSEVETVGLKHADNLETLEEEMMNEQFNFTDNPIEVIDLQEQPKFKNTNITPAEILYGSSETSDSTNTSNSSLEDDKTFYTAKAKEMDMI